MAHATADIPGPASDDAPSVAATISDAPAVSPAVELLIKPAEARSHYDRSTIVHAKPGDAVAKAKPEVALIAVGEGVALDADGVTLRATAAGRVVLEADRVRIEQSLVIEKNVDFSTGHVEFAHDVEVMGNVCDLFKVTAGAHLHVHGVIEAADVRAGAGLRAAGGISCKGKGRVAVEGDVHAKYLANSTVAATGNVTALMIAHSRVVCGGKLTVSEGPVLAGHVTATSGVECIVLGSAAGVKTVVEAGIDEGLRTMAQVKVPEVEQLLAKAKKIRETVRPLMENQKRLTPQQKERATELLFEADEFQAQADALLATMKKANDAVAARSKLQVEVEQAIYPGVTIRFPGVYATIHDALAGPLRVATKAMHGETRIVMYYGRSGTAHSLTTHADPDDFTVALKKLLAPPAPEKTAPKLPPPASNQPAPMKFPVKPKPSAKK
jgi:hypothetical protein